MNIDTNIFNKTPANKIQQHIKDIIQYEEVEFIPSMQGWFNIQKSINVIHLINRIKEKTHISMWLIDHLSRHRKTFDKIQHSFMI